MTDFLDLLTKEFTLPIGNPVLVFSLILFIILLSPILLRKINIPGIIGLIIAGVIIGPHGLHWLERNSAIELFSTIGLLYIMFIAGLELDMNEFKANRNKSLVFGLFTFAIPLTIGFPVCYYLLGYGIDTSFLVASMFATHTLVTYPIVSKSGISKNQAVAITVGGTILTDTAVLLILAVIVGKSQGAITQEFWIRLGISLLAFSLIMFLVIPRIAKWFFQKLESEKHSHYIFVLSVVFFAAFLAELAGVEPIIGAFIAGLALNKLIPHSSALMNRIEFIGNSLFIPFFLISVGMLVDVRVILSGPMAWIIAGTLTVVALLGKWLAALFTQLTFKYSRAQRELIFGLSSAHAAATLAIILVGYNVILGTDSNGEPIRLLDDNILNGTIILILITCIVASFATEKASKTIIVETEEDDSELINENNSSHNEQILLPIASISKLEKILEFATLIKNKKSQKPLSVLSVVSNDREAEMNILKARNKLEEFVKQASATETKVEILTTIDHNAAGGIIRIARELLADIIILGWSRHAGFLDRLIGEKTDDILAGTEKTVFICHLEKPLAVHKKIVIAVPPLAEYENGFRLWLTKITKLAQELSISIQLYCNDSTYKAILKLIKKEKLSASIKYESFTEWEDILILTRNIHKDDFLVLVSARKGATSHLSVLDNLPSKLQKYFTENSRLIIYPQEYDVSIMVERFHDISSEPLNKSIEAVQKIGKGIGSIFKKKEQE